MEGRRREELVEASSQGGGGRYGETAQGTLTSRFRKRLVV